MSTSSTTVLKYMAPTSLGKRKRPIWIFVAAEHCFEALERAAVPFRIVTRKHS